MTCLFCTSCFLFCASEGEHCCIFKFVLLCRCGSHYNSSFWRLYIYIYAHTLLFVVVLFSLGCLHVINMSFSFFVQVLWSYKVALFNFICMLCHFFWCQCWHQCIIVALCHVIFILCQCLPYENGLFFTYARFLFLFFNVLVPTFLPCGGKC